LQDRLETIKLEHAPKGGNKMADALANLVATLALGAQESITILVCSQWVVIVLEYGCEEEVKIVSI